MSPEIAVVVPTYKDLPQLRLCLECLVHQTIPTTEYRVVVVNNDTSAHLDDLRQQFPSVSFLTEPKPGSYAARNLGIRSTTEPILAFTDADCLPTASWLENARTALIAGADIVAGHVELTFGGRRLSGSESYELVFGFDQSASVTQGYAATANLISWRRCFDETALFDDSLMSGGDTRWTKNASLSGLSLVYVAQSIVRHPARATLRQVLMKARRVAGGRSSAGTAPTIWRTLLAGWLPPLSLFTKVTRHPTLTLSQKFNACGIAWLVKLQFHVTCLAIALGLSRPNRR
jgi:glycosyltransferase involved in cell wall biosynthesis